MRRHDFALARPGKVGGLLIVSLVLNLALLSGGAYLYSTGKFATPAGSAGTGAGTAAPNANLLNSTSDVNALGRIQPFGGLISVFGPPGDRVTKFNVKLGDGVAIGKPLGELSGSADRQLQLDSLEVQVKEAKALKESILASSKAKLADIDAEARQASVGVEQDLRAINAKLKAVAYQVERAKNELKRLTDAKTAGVTVSAQEFEQVNGLLVTASAEAEATEAQKNKLSSVREEGEKSLAAKKASVEAETQRALAQVPQASLEAAVKAAESKLGEALLRAPAAGRVVRLLAKPGETLTNQPVLQLADTKRMSLLAEVYETDIGRLRDALKNGPVKVEATTAALGKDGTLTGQVLGTASVATVISKNVLGPLGPREDADRRVVEVEVELDDASSARAANYIGLQVQVRFKQ